MRVIEAALANLVYVDENFEPGSEPNKVLMIGYEMSGRSIELIVNVLDDGDVLVFHAMKLRSVFRPLLRRVEKGKP